MEIINVIWCMKWPFPNLRQDIARAATGLQEVLKRILELVWKITNGNPYNNGKSFFWGLQSTIFIRPFLTENMSAEKAWQRSLESAYEPSQIKPFEESTPPSSSFIGPVEDRLSCGLLNVTKGHPVLLIAPKNIINLCRLLHKKATKPLSFSELSN